MRTIKGLPFKPHRLSGYSDTAVLTHYETVYGKLLQRYQTMDAGDSASVSVATALDLHEIYFESLGGEDGLGSVVVEPEGLLARLLIGSFGSIDEWREAFVQRASDSSHTWIALNYESHANRLVVNGYDEFPALSGLTPVIAIYMAEQVRNGYSREEFVELFMQNLHWQRGADKLQQRMTAGDDSTLANGNEVNQFDISPEQLMQTLDQGEPPLILDICLGEDLPARYDTLPKARFLQAEAFDHWSSRLPAADDCRIVIYCMYGFQVSENATSALRDKGYDARRLAGGIAAWRAIGGTIQALPPGAEFDA